MPVLFFTILTNFNIQIFEQLKGYDKLSKTIIMLSEKEGTKNVVIQDRMLYALMSYHLRDFDFVFYIPGPSSLKITVSPFSRNIFWCVSFEILDNAALGSPWDPVQINRTWF